MKVELPHAPFLEAVTAVERVSGKNLALPVLQTVLLEATRTGLMLRSTNLELGIERQLPAKVTEEGVVCVPAGLMANTISHLRGVTPVVLATDEHTLSVMADNGSARLKLVSPEEFPPLPKVEEKAVKLPAAALMRVLRSVSYSASASTIKPELGSVSVYSGESGIIAVATDSFRLAEKIVPYSGAAVPPMLIPIRSVNEIAKVLEEMGEGEAALSVGEHQMALAGEGVYLTSRLVEGTFPDYRKIIPTAFTSEAVMLRADILHVLRRATVFADKFNQVTFTIDPGSKTFSVFTKNTEVGEVNDAVAAAITGEAITMSFNLRYVTDAFQSIAVDSVSFSFAGAGKPMVIRGVADHSFTYLVMPMNR